MSLTTVYILTFTHSQKLFKDNVNYQDTLGIWAGECTEDPELTLVVIAGSAELDTQSFFDLTPKQQQRTEMPVAALLACLNAPVTEVAITALKADCDYTQAASLIDGAMQTVLDAKDCVATVWKTSVKEAIFIVGWSFVEAHENYHQAILANTPDCIKQLPNIIESDTVLHATFRPIQSGMNKMPQDCYTY